MPTKTTKKTKHSLPPKKTLKVFPSEVHATLYRIAYAEGGTVPDKVSGQFNSKKAANAFLEAYLAEEERNKSYINHVRDKENAEIKDEDRK